MHLRDIQSAEATDSKHYFPTLDQGYTYLGIALAGEVGEACNFIKKYERGSISETELVEELGKELADILIYLVMLADRAGVDLEVAYTDKKEFNEQRYRKPFIPGEAPGLKGDHRFA